MGLPTIIQSPVKELIAAAMQGVAAVTTATVEARSAADNRRRGPPLIIISHLRHICVVAGDDGVPSIWREMVLVCTKVEVLALLLQFFLTGMRACQSIFHGHSGLLHISLPLFNRLLGGISPWTSLQVMVNRGEAVASTLADIGAQDFRLANAYILAHGAKLTLSIIVRAYNLRRELGTFCYILTDLFCRAFPYVCELKEIVEWVASN